MNRIVRDHYPVSKLPEDLREGLGPDDEVRVTIDGPALEELAPEHSAAPVPHPLSYYKQFRLANYASMQEIVDYITALRDEWSSPPSID